eukprot:3947061-Lingulodinium_polyedra.AAC.1
MFLESIQAQGKRLVERGLLKEEDAGRVLELPIVPRELCLSCEDMADGRRIWAGASGDMAYPSSMEAPTTPSPYELETNL